MEISSSSMAEWSRLLVNIFLTIQVLILCNKNVAKCAVNIEFEMDLLPCELTFQHNLEDCLNWSMFYKIKHPPVIPRHTNLLVTIFLDYHCRWDSYLNMLSFYIYICFPFIFIYAFLLYLYMLSFHIYICFPFIFIYAFLLEIQPLFHIS